MLDVLLRSAGQLVPASRLLAELWGPGAEDSTHYLRFHMARLRRKLEDDPPRPRHLLTEPGMGYRYAAVRRSEQGLGHEFRGSRRTCGPPSRRAAAAS